MNARGVCVVLGAVLCAGLVYGITAQQPVPSGRIPLDARRLLGTPQSFRNLTLIPVYAPGVKATNAFMTLDEGLKAKVVKVREAKGGGEVNRLYIKNMGQKPLYIMAGEVVVGGQQDRSFAEDSVIPPNEKEVPVTAFCVEHGRWSGSRDFGDTAKSVASLEVRASVQKGSFESAAARLPASSAVPVNPAENSIARGQAQSRAGRNGHAAVGRAQQEVWDRVAAKNRRFKAENATGTYRTLLNAESGEAKRTINPYLKALEHSLDKDPSLVGILVAINGKVVSADIFGDPGLFRRLWPKLLRAYAADAAEHASTMGTKPPVTVTAQMGKAFVAAATDTRAKAVIHSKGSATLRLDSRSALLYQFKPEAKGAEGMAGVGGADGGLHTNIIRK